MNNCKVMINKTNRAYALQEMYFFEFHAFSEQPKFLRGRDMSFSEFKKRYNVDDSFIEHIKTKYRKGLCSHTMVWFKYDFVADEFFENEVLPLETAVILSNN